MITLIIMAIFKLFHDYNLYLIANFDYAKVTLFSQYIHDHDNRTLFNEVIEQIKPFLKIKQLPKYQVSVFNLINRSIIY